MIYFNGIFSIIEGIYLEEEITDRLISSDIVVNPNNSSYIFNKIVILNMPGIDKTTINRLFQNNNEIISRIPGYDNRIKVVPYLEKILFQIKWNGKIEEFIGNSNIEDINFEVDYPFLYFPKASSWNNTIINDTPTALGYLLYQVGIDNVINNKLFNSLDIIKCKKGIF